MGTIKDMTQKIKGKAQQAHGNILSNSGKNMEGAMQKAKGKVNETMADIKMREKAQANRGM